MPHHEADPVESPPLTGAERRTAPRFGLLQRCFARPPRPDDSAPGDERPEGWRTIAYNISATGIGITLPFNAPTGAIIEVEPWRLPGAPVLRAHVIHTRALEYVWLCGCEFAEPLSEAVLAAWVAGARPGARFRQAVAAL